MAWLSVWSKVQTFLVLAHLASPGQRAVKRVYVCVCVFIQKLLSQFSDALIIVFWEKASERNDTRFTGLIPFVSLNQQCHSTERNTKHGSQSHSFFIHYQTPEGRDIAHFTLAR